MELITAKSAGFCFGVSRAMSLAEKAAERQDGVYTFGPLIHNKEVAKALGKKGVIQLLPEVSALDDLTEGTLILRSHGVSREVYDAAKRQGLSVVDGTCPYVKRIHTIVERESGAGKQILIAGSPSHPEVLGIAGWCMAPPLILAEPSDAAEFSLEPSGRYVLVVQTTFRRDKLTEMLALLSDRGIHPEVFDTICEATSVRQAEAAALSQKVDKMLIIGDKSSSNTQKLYEVSRKNCRNTYYIETNCDLVLNIFSCNDKIGITAGASTPPAIIKEVVGRMSEALKDTAQDMEEEMTFQQMVDESWISLHTGDVVMGKVIQISNEEVSVNLGYKSDGVIPRGEYSSDASIVPSKVLQPGDEIEVFVVRVNDGDGNVLLSKKRIEAQKGMEELETAYNDKTIVTGKVSEVVKGGLIVVINGVRVFIPSSQVSNRFIEDLSVFKGQDISFNIIELDRVKRRIIGGRKALIEKEMQEKKAALFSSLEIGSKMTGTVSRITDFGAFIDLGGVDGLVHISEMSWGRISNPREVLKQGQEVEVIVLDADKDKGKISLSLKDSEKNPWKLAAEKYIIGSIIEGKVVRMVPFGAFVELEPGVDGLVHISQIANKHVVRPEDELKIGDRIQVKILDVNTEQKKISLSKRQVEEAAAEEAEETSEEA